MMRRRTEGEEEEEEGEEGGAAAAARMSDSTAGRALTEACIAVNGVVENAILLQWKTLLEDPVKIWKNSGPRTRMDVSLMLLVLMTYRYIPKVRTSINPLIEIQCFPNLYLDQAYILH